VYLCRTVRDTIPLAFSQQSLIVIGRRPSWWPTRTERLRRVLEAAGHMVVGIDPSGATGSS
jgi:hypothetical protein